MTVGSQSTQAGSSVRTESAVGAAVARIASVLERRNVLAIISGDYRAQDLLTAMEGAAPDAELLFFAPSDALPGDAQPPTAANTGKRLATLRRARQLARVKGRRVLCITTAEAASEMLPKPQTFDGALTRFSVGGRIEPEAFRIVVGGIGYFEDDRVDEPAEFAVRGRVIDIFPVNTSHPVRMEIADGVIQRIREFSSVSQRGVKDLSFVELGSAAWPVMLGRGHTLFDFFPNAVIAIDPGAAAERERYLALAADALHARQKKLTPASQTIVNEAVWAAATNRRGRIDLSAGKGEREIRFSANVDPVKAMNTEIASALKARDRIVVAGAEQEIRLLKKRLPRKLAAGARPLQNWRQTDLGWINRVKLLNMQLPVSWSGHRKLVICAGEVLRGHPGAVSEADAGSHLLEIGDICVGDVVIHEDHGIAVISGLKPPSGSSVSGEGIELEYAAGARRIVPVEEADRIWRYGADRTAVTLDSLDGASWRKRRVMIDRSMSEAAADLTHHAKSYAKKRAVRIDPDPGAYADFVAGFPFSETPDQSRAIIAVRDDLSSGKPMDRLVVGDVGYGKTEVALRAAALTALAGKQVVVAAPTTVLARQHYEIFRKRFDRLGVRVASLSRLVDISERKRVKAGLADGSISVVVGTAAVAAEAVGYADLALVVIDEEQRFGASDKARLRELAGDSGHLLSLTATPIPRTLQNALLGVKKLSVIATPPARRQPIRTLTGVFDETQVRAALLRERDRGGQSFVVVPRIEDLSALADTIRRLAPELSVLEAHGGMPATAIDTAMVRFASGLDDVLLATNIIEAGLDVPRANTMIVWRADRFGLAQLHQLRGRVGRGSRRGFILLTTEPGSVLTEATRKRLRTLESLDRLGAGFAISARDLDIRGAGDLVGDAQSGHMKLIGIDLYQNLLERAVREAQGEIVERWTPVMSLGLSGRIPPDWIPEPDTRLALYLRLSRLASHEELSAFEDECVDRFGAAPPEAVMMLRLARLRIRMREAGMARLDAGPLGVAFSARVPPSKRATATAGLVDRNGRFVADRKIVDPLERLAWIEKALDQLCDG